MSVSDEDTNMNEQTHGRQIIRMGSEGDTTRQPGEAVGIVWRRLAFHLGVWKIHNHKVVAESEESQRVSERHD